MSDDAKTWLCRWCTFEGLTRAHIVSHELDAHPKFYSARETAGCGCGPNEACSRCSTPLRVSDRDAWATEQPAQERRLDAEARRSTPGPASPVLEAVGAPPPCTCDRRPGEYRHASTCRLLAWMRTTEQGIREASRPMVGLDELLPQCVHQWLPWTSSSGMFQAWCPNCDDVRAPGERKR